MLYVYTHGLWWCYLDNHTRLISSSGTIKVYMQLSAFDESKWNYYPLPYSFYLFKSIELKLKRIIYYQSVFCTLFQVCRSLFGIKMRICIWCTHIAPSTSILSFFFMLYRIKIEKVYLLSVIVIYTSLYIWCKLFKILVKKGSTQQITNR